MAAPQRSATGGITMTEFSTTRRDLRRAEYRARRVEHGLRSRIILSGKIIALHAGYYVGVVGGFMWFGIARDKAPDVAAIGGIVGVIAAVGCTVGLGRVM